jgi:ATP-binding cassette subfamily B (MDR/TAP) protein 1
MTIVFGNLVNDFNGFALGIVPASKFRSDLNHNPLWFIYLFLVKFGVNISLPNLMAISDHFQLFYIANFLLCFTATRITRRIRLQYLNKMLHQSLSYFDRHPPSSIATSLSTDTNMIEVGLADKVASLCQGCGMIIGAFGIGFAKSWRLALVISTTLIWMIGVTMVLGATDSKLQSKQRAIYSQASTITEEALSSVLSITALGAKDRIIEKFKRPLAKARRIELRIGPVQASIYGNMFFTMQCGYALALFYGIKLLSHGEIKNGGTVVKYTVGLLPDPMLTFNQCAILYTPWDISHGPHRPLNSKLH